MPARLQAVPLTAAPCNVFPAQTTMLCVTLLRKLEESYLFKTSDGDGFDETIVDRAMDWLSATVRPL